MTDTNYNIPYVIDPNYLRQRYLVTIAELETLFGELRNRDDEGRLELLQEALDGSDKWIDNLYAEIGVTQEVRHAADDLEAQMLDQLKDILGFDPTAPQE